MPPPLPSRPSLNGNIDHHGPPPVNQTVRHHQPYYRSYSSSSSASFKGCCCCLFLLFAFLALVVLAVVLIVMLAVKPKKPQFDLQQVAVMNMGISSPDNPNPSVMDPTSASLSFTIRMLFTAGNPNKVGIRYGESSFTVLYKGIPLGRATVPGFYQDAHSTRNVEATIAVDRVNLMQGMAADIVRDASLNDRVELTVRGDVSGKIRVMNFDSLGVQNISVKFFSEHIAGRHEGKTVTLRSDASKKTWKVKMEGQRLTQGWKEFLKEHDLGVGDFIVFRHERDMLFTVTALGPSCCEIQYPPSGSPRQDEEESYETERSSRSEKQVDSLSDR